MTKVKTTVDPVWLTTGNFAATTAVTDDYFTDDHETTLAHIIDALVSYLPPPQRAAVELTVFAGLSYGDAGKQLGKDKKTVWRHRNAGVATLKRQLTRTPWVATLCGDQLPRLFED